MVVGWLVAHVILVYFFLLGLDKNICFLLKKIFVGLNEYSPVFHQRSSVDFNWMD